jgi:cytochrome c oxidase subunit 1
MRLLSGQFITWGEFFTMGLTIFAALMTIWLARPVKMTPALKFVLASIFGFLMGGAAGLTQANTGLNMVFHNTQWVIALHAHTFLLTAAGSLVFAVLYALVPMLTKIEFRFKQLVNVHLVLWLTGAILNAYAMGMAGANGMLRRTIYEGTQYQPYVVVAMIGGILMGLGLVVFLVNVIGTLGLGNVLSLFVPDRWLARRKAAPARA